MHLVCLVRHGFISLCAHHGLLVDHVQACCNIIILSIDYQQCLCCIYLPGIQCYSVKACEGSTCQETWQHQLKWQQQLRGVQMQPNWLNQSSDIGAKHAHHWFGISKVSFAQSQPMYYIRSCHSFIHYTLFNPQIRCVAADTLWQPSSQGLPCLGIPPSCN